MERNLNEVDSCDLEEKALVAVEPCLNKEVPTEYYVYGLDTNDGRIAAAWLCPNEQTAERAYQEAMRQMDSEHLTGQFQFGYIGVDSCAAIEYTHGGFRKVGFFKQKDFTFAASLTKKPVLLAKEHHCIANDLSDFMRRAGMILEELAATDRSKEPVLELDTPAASQQIETAKECFALVFDSSSCDPLRPIDDAMIFHETEAVIAIGKLTDEQYRRLPGEFDKRYTGAKRVFFTIEGGWGAHFIPDIPKDMLCCLTECPLSEYLREQNDLQREMLAVLKEIKEKTPTEKIIFDSVYRAVARFIPPRDEVPIEKVHRLRCDNVEWKYIGRIIYQEENGEKIDEKDLPSYVDQLRKQHKREYPEFYKTKK